MPSKDKYPQCLLEPGVHLKGYPLCMKPLHCTMNMEFRAYYATIARIHLSCIQISLFYSDQGRDMQCNLTVLALLEMPFNEDIVLSTLTKILYQRTYPNFYSMFIRNH